ncbi:hypothetical protein MPTK1_1g05290 [Marchantia polymorpha subsp. ruderalis]|uniref:PIH1 N-terminal domain-containing protein n=2 Tax=Marchantia polymorpha TaxID=3197 RepID=A0AAF6ALQ6_MARPO|nr:hypothetical protein MARPO_0005s0079 [Marchantia polymorpha]PTQ48431.1 hypothetical protein MARPO_0005s0079 [Marchantia polymorpha]BBM97375.1 hypothetical protein Mp_1g05290 [Marchantia polymorpha subsp. ruderalis]BBM97376.1 hypothetical protein Mp_1g05290 [Marchantia polymorpha subsp. ruderalis]|eukprot:PTQ48430.1 hypothetical protein MARPO_0005s0079 [Marchantia polymorpha]
MKIEEVEDEPLRSDKELEAAMKLLQSYEKARNEGVAPKNSELEALLDAMKQQHDPSTGNITLPKFATDRAQSETIVPKPFFVIKSLTVQGEKIFINICGSPKIPAPDEWQEGVPAEVEEAAKASNETGSLLDIPNVRFPVSCSDPVTSTDHGGKACRVFDMVYNSAILEFTMTNKKMKLFLIEMATTWISQKYSLELSSDFKLPHMKYKGEDVARQQIRATSTAPLVSEVPCDSNLEPSFALLTKPITSKSQAPRANEKSTPRSSIMSADLSPQAASSHTSCKPLEDISEPSCDQRPRGGVTSTVSPESEQSVMTLPSAQAPPSRTNSLSLRSSLSPPDAMPTNRNGERKLADLLQFPVANKHVGPPLIEMAYSSRPADAVFVLISFPQRELEDLEVFATHTQLHIRKQCEEPIQILLPFCSELEAADASYEISTGLLSIKLPYLPYGKALADDRGAT